jgi:hypothetical protein
MPTDYADIFTSNAWQRHASDEADMAAQEESYVGDPPSAISLDPAQMFTVGSPDLAEMHAGHFLNALWAIAAPVQGWLNFRLSDTDNMSSGAVVFQFGPVATGWEWKVNRLAISIPGASAAATAAVYVAPGMGETAPDESYLVDFASALLGSTPSRNISVPIAPYYLTENDVLLVNVAGGAAGTAAASARIDGIRRQKL